MAATPDMIKFRAEYVAADQETMAPLRAAVTTDHVTQGGSVVFLVTSYTGVATDRGASGDIPYVPDDYTQITCTLQASYAAWAMNGFSIFAAQSDLRKAAQANVAAKMNNKIMTVILAAMSATSNTKAAATASQAWVEDILATMSAAAVPVTQQENMFGYLSPKAWSRLRQIPEFASKDYVNIPVLSGGYVKALPWSGVNWFSDSRVTGIGTAAEECYVWHRSGIGYAANMSDMQVDAGYDPKQRQSWCNAELFHGAKLLKSSSVVKALHDAT